MPTAEPQRVLLAGATGLVGGHLLRQLLAATDVAEVVAVGRRRLPPSATEALPPEHRDKLTQAEVDFTDLAAAPDGLFDVQAAFCALGTTMGQAGSRERFRQVDQTFPLALAGRALAGGARRFLVVSAVGAGAASPFFYGRVKGELERDLMALGFPGLTIVRPSFLRGSRERARPGEAMAGELFRLVPGRLRAVHGADVAAAMIDAWRRDAPGVEVLPSHRMVGAAGA